MSASRTGASSAEPEEIATAQRMHQLITRSLLVQAIFVASRLRIPDLLADAARTAQEVAEATGAQPAAVQRLLRALTGLDVVTLDGERFGLTSLGRSLCAGAHSAAETAMFMGSPAMWSAWGALGDAVLDGEAGFRHAHGAGLFDYLSGHPDELSSFQALMSAQSRLQIPAVLTAYDFTSAHTIVDVGGGQGALLAALLAANPGARGVLFDLPDVVARSGPILASVTPRCDVVPGDLVSSRQSQDKCMTTTARTVALDPSHPQQAVSVCGEGPCLLISGQGAPGTSFEVRSWSPVRQKADPELRISLLACVGTAGLEPATP